MCWIQACVKTWPLLWVSLPWNLKAPDGAQRPSFPAVFVLKNAALLEKPTHSARAGCSALGSCQPRLQQRRHINTDRHTRKSEKGAGEDGREEKSQEKKKTQEASGTGRGAAWTISCGLHLVPLFPLFVSVRTTALPAEMWFTKEKASKILSSFLQVTRLPWWKSVCVPLS